jgi:hypothetical protein
MRIIPYLLWLALAPRSALTPTPKLTVEHRIEQTGNHFSPATVQMIQAMIDQQLASLRQGERHPREVLYDAASASNQREHERICGGMLVMVVAIATDAKELPLHGLFLRAPQGDRLPLILVAELPAKLGAQIRLGASLGSHLWAGIYYAPVAKHLHGVVEADFAAGRSGFALANEMILTQQIIQYGDEHLQDTPSAAALSAMIAREYPGFVVDSDTLKTLEQAH